MNAPFKPDFATAAPLRPRSYLDELFDAQVLFDMGVDGLYGRSGVYEDVLERFDALFTRYGRDMKAEKVHFPPAMPRRMLEKTGYLKTFPQLAGCVHCFMGDEADYGTLVGKLDRGEAWSDMTDPSAVVLTPATCYPLYPTVARRGRLPAGGGTYDLRSYCFRHEPSQEATRQLMFRMREYVRIGSEAEVRAFRETWLQRTQEMCAALGLPVVVDLANDPFFGRIGQMMANNQRDQGLKFELMIPVNSPDKPSACVSFNYHQDHFGTLWDLHQHDGAPAHSACIGIGLDRLTLALFRHHGFDPAAWPARVREVLWG